MENNEENKVIQTKEDLINTIVGLAIFVVIGIILFNFLFGNSSEISSVLAIEAEVYAKKQLSRQAVNAAESEIEFSVADEKDGKCILKCKTTNEILINLYGKTFYFGYSPNIGNTYNYSIDKSKSVVKEEINW